MNVPDLKQAVVVPAATAAGGFPPVGWVTNRQAAERLGVGLETLTCMSWKWRAMLREIGRCVRPPGGGRCNIYSMEGIERIRAAQAAAAVDPAIPEGLVDTEGACRMFGVTRHVWKNWQRAGKIDFGQIRSSPSGRRQKLYAIDDLNRLKEKLFGEDKLYKVGNTGRYHVPADLMTREQACEQFGVNTWVWWRWEREGKITDGRRLPFGPKVYKVEDVNRMLDEYGRWAPPYADAERPGVYRVPLGGRDIERREALIDADCLPLIEGGSCTWSPHKDSGFVIFTRGDVNGVPLRRIIMGVEDGDLNVRHVNDNPLDCRRENLVLRTVKQRSRNTRKMKTHNGEPVTSRFKGVYWETQTKKWRAGIKVDGKSKRLGRFGDQMAAAEAYDEAARRWFGEDARLNFPDGVEAWLENEGFITPKVAKAA